MKCTKRRRKGKEARCPYQVESTERKSIAVRILAGLGKLVGEPEERESNKVDYEHMGHRC